MRLIELEQTIISGVDENGNSAKESDISKQILKVIKSLKRHEDILRLLSLYVCCYTLPDADFKTILKMVD